MSRPRSRSPEDDGPRIRSTSGRPFDPVCGMEVDPAEAIATRSVGDSTFFLCSAMCLEAFDRDPGRYAHQGHAEHPHRHQHAGCC